MFPLFSRMLHNFVRRFCGAFLAVPRCRPFFLHRCSVPIHRCCCCVSTIPPPGATIRGMITTTVAKLGTAITSVLLMAWAVLHSAARHIRIKPRCKSASRQSNARRKAAGSKRRKAESHAMTAITPIYYSYYSSFHFP